jgi:hypothetical protein
MRHVRKTETTCPFCEERLVVHKLPDAVPFRRVAAAAAVATGVASITGCTITSGVPLYGGAAIIEDSGGSSQQDAPTGVPHYGSPFFDAGVTVQGDGSPEDASAPDGASDAPLEAGSDAEHDATPEANGDAPDGT